jgi:hypothetical protein
MLKKIRLSCGENLHHYQRQNLRPDRPIRDVIDGSGYREMQAKFQNDFDV